MVARLGEAWEDQVLQQLDKFSKDARIMQDNIEVPDAPRKRAFIKLTDHPVKDEGAAGKFTASVDMTCEVERFVYERCVFVKQEGVHF